jgi:hypothetical protein
MIRRRVRDLIVTLAAAMLAVFSDFLIDRVDRKEGVDDLNMPNGKGACYEIPKGYTTAFPSTYRCLYARRRTHPVYQVSGLNSMVEETTISKHHN